MKVILTQEVKGKGGEGDVIDVATGYAVNYLFPRKMAIQATSGNLKQLELRQHNIHTREESRLVDAASVAASLEGKVVTIEAKVGDEGRLFGSITPQMIEDAIAGQLDVDVDRKKMDVHGLIKQIGEHQVSVHVYRDVKATVTVNVIGEGGVVATPAAAPAPEPEADVDEAPTDEVEGEVVEEADADVTNVSDDETIPQAEDAVEATEDTAQDDTDA